MSILMILSEMSFEDGITEVLTRVKAAADDDSRREIFMETLFDWADHYTENLASSGETSEARQGRVQISELWLAYARMEGDLGDMTRASQIFSDALEDPAASLVAETYSRFASHCMSTASGKKAEPAEAARVLHLGLQKDGMPETELKKLQAAQAAMGAKVKKEGGGVEDDDLFAPTGGGDYKEMQAEAAADLFSAEMMRLHESNRDGGEEEEDGETGESTAGYTPELLIKKFHTKPPFIFESEDGVVSSSGSGNRSATLTPEAASLLEGYLGVSLAEEESQFMAAAGGILDVLEALWITQAAKERMYSKWYDDLRTGHSKELKMRDAAVGTSSEEASDNRVRARNRCAVQKEVLTAIVYKSMWHLVQEHHRLLIRVGFPGFTLATLDALENHLFSSDVSTSKSMAPALAQSLSQQKSLVNALMSRRKGKHTDGTLPVAAKVDPRLARKRQREATKEGEKGKAPAVKVEQTEAAVDTAKPLTLGQQPKVMPAPDAAALAKLQEQELNPPKRTRAKRK